MREGGTADKGKRAKRSGKNVQDSGEGCLVVELLPGVLPMMDSVSLRLPSREKHKTQENMGGPKKKEQLIC